MGAAPADGRPVAPDGWLTDVLAAQVAAVDVRVRGSAAYEQESTEVRRAAEAVGRLHAELGLGRCLGNLTPGTGKPQFLLLFEPSPGSAGPGQVLKVYGRRRPGEAAVQRAWGASGVPTPGVLASGDDPVSWLLMEHVPDAHPPVLAADVLESRTRELAAVMRSAHGQAAVTGEGIPDLLHGVLPHLDAVVASLVRHDYRPPAGWRSRAQATYRLGGVVSLHGDLVGNNLLSAGGRLWLVDICGYLGDPAFDAARWAVREARPGQPADRLLDVWLAEEPDVDRSVARCMLAVESLMQAGVREIVKDEQGQPTATRDAVTLDLLAQCERLWEAPA